MPFLSPIQALIEAKEAVPDNIMVHFQEVEISSSRKETDIAGTTCWRYRRLYQAVAEIGSYWRAEQWVLPGQIVGVALPEGPLYIIAMLSIWWCGGVYMPLPVNPLAEQVDNLEKVSAISVVTDKNISTRWAFPKTLRRLYLEAPDDVALTAPVILKPDDPATLYVSSGTTGKSKLILNRFEGMSARLKSAADLMSISPQDNVLGYFQREFDASLFDVLLVLYNKLSLVLLPDNVRLKMPLLFYSYCERLPRAVRPTVAVLLPELLEKLPPQKHTSLRKVMVIGTKPHQWQLKQWFANDTRLFNGFGLTEANMALTIQRIMPDQTSYPMTMCLEGVELFIKLAGGEALYDVFRLKDEHPEGGVEGELVISGEGLGRYIQTAEMLETPDYFKRFGSFEGKRVYFSGDIVTWDGTDIFFKGRSDRQIKRSGQLVNLEDAEQRLCHLKQASGQPFFEQVVLHVDAPSSSPLVSAYVYTSSSIISPRYAKAYFEKLKEVESRYRPNFTFYVDRPLLGGNKNIIRNIETIRTFNPSLLLCVASPHDTSDLGLALKQQCFDFFFSKYNEPPQAALPIPIEDITLDAPLETLGWCSFCFVGFITGVLESYLPVVFEEDQDRFANQLKKLEPGSTLREIEKIIQEHIQHTVGGEMSLPRLSPPTTPAQGDNAGVTFHY